MAKEKLDFFETQFDEFGEVLYVNETDVADMDVADELKREYPEIARAINQWNSRAATRGQTAFHQDRYVAPTNFFDELRTASYAAKYDDIVSNAVDTTEQLAFKRVKVESTETLENDVWRQVMDEINLEQRLREIWREVFIYSQCYVAVKWKKKNYRPDVKTNTKRSRSSFEVTVPVGISILDPLKVVPVGTFMFGQERLAYIADQNQIEEFDKYLANANSSNQDTAPMIEKKYKPSASEAELLADLTGESDIERRLYLLNEQNVFRITSTRPSYQRTADVRLASIFELLDLKHLLREVDRTELLSSTNAIILVKKGSDDLPASQTELSGVHQQMAMSAKIPLIISDHRIEIEIITRKNDKTLATEKYNGLDSRITSRLYQVMSTGNYSSGTAVDDSPKLFRIISSTMEARRDNIRDTVMDNIIIPTWERNPKFEEKPEMKFYPRRIALDFDNNIATFIQDLKDRNILSAETQLAELDIEIDNEMEKIRREMDLYGDVLEMFAVPYTAPGSPSGIDSKSAGRNLGGNKNGGGRNSESTNPNPASPSDNKDKQ